jgi:hypothetical protein
VRNRSAVSRTTRSRTSVGRACTAEEFVKQLDGDAQARQSHLAPYLRARTTLREHEVAEGRNQRIGAYQCAA